MQKKKIKKNAQSINVSLKNELKMMQLKATDVQPQVVEEEAEKSIKLRSNARKKENI